MKKAFLLLFLVVFGFVLMACDETTTTSTVATTTTTTTQTTTTTTTTTAAPLPGELPPLADYVVKASDPEDLATIPPGATVYTLDFTTTTPVESFTGVFNGTNTIEYSVPGVGTIKSLGFSNEAQLGTVESQDEDGLHFHVNRIGDWSNNGYFEISNILPSNLEVTAGAFYSIYVELKWESGARPIRLIYAGKDNLAIWGDLAQNTPVGQDFEVLKHTEFFVPGTPGAPTTLANTTSLQLRVGWMVGDKQIDVDQTLIVKKITIIRGQGSSINTTMPENSVRAYAIGGVVPTYDGSFVEMFVPVVGEGSQMPAVVFTGLQLLENQEYQLKFSLSSLRKRSLEVFIGYYDEWGRLVPLQGAPEKIEINSYSSQVNQTVIFTWEGASIHDALLIFSYGDVGTDAVPTTIKVGNVSLVQTDPAS